MADDPVMIELPEESTLSVVERLRVQAAIGDGVEMSADALRCVVQALSQAEGVMRHGEQLEAAYNEQVAAMNETARRCDADLARLRRVLRLQRGALVAALILLAAMIGIWAL